MNLNEDLKATGSLVVTLYDAQGAIKEERSIPNLIVTVGKNYIASRMTGTTSSVMSHMGIGAGTTAAAAGDTALGTALGSRVTLSAATPSGSTVTYTATFPAGTGTGAVTEAGIFNALTGGDMLCRTVFPVVNKQVADTIAVTWVVTVS